MISAGEIRGETKVGGGGMRAYMTIYPAKGIERESTPPHVQFSWVNSEGVVEQFVVGEALGHHYQKLAKPEPGLKAVPSGSVPLTPQALRMCPQFSVRKGEERHQLGLFGVEGFVGIGRFCNRHSDLPDIDKLYFQMKLNDLDTADQFAREAHCKAIRESFEVATKDSQCTYDDIVDDFDYVGMSLVSHRTPEILFARVIETDNPALMEAGAALALALAVSESPSLAESLPEALQRLRPTRYLMGLKGAETAGIKAAEVGDYEAVQMAFLKIREVLRLTRKQLGNSKLAEDLRQIARRSRGMIVLSLAERRHQEAVQLGTQGDYLAAYQTWKEADQILSDAEDRLTPFQKTWEQYVLPLREEVNSTRLEILKAATEARNPSLAGTDAGNPRATQVAALDN